MCQWRKNIRCDEELVLDVHEVLRQLDGYDIVNKIGGQEYLEIPFR